MTFEELFLTLKDYFAGKDFKDFGKGDYSYEFNVTGEGEGKFYLEVKDGSPDIQPFDYKNCLCSFTSPVQRSTIFPFLSTIGMTTKSLL